MAADVETRLGEHSAHIDNIRKEQDRVRTTLEDLIKSHRTLVSEGKILKQTLEVINERTERMDAHPEDDGIYLVRLVRNNLDRISLWLVLALVLIQLLGKEKAVEILGQGLFG
jgi:hypothetical protein